MCTINSSLVIRKRNRNWENVFLFIFFLFFSEIRRTPPHNLRKPSSSHFQGLKPITYATRSFSPFGEKLKIDVRGRPQKSKISRQNLGENFQVQTKKSYFQDMFSMHSRPHGVLKSKHCEKIFCVCFFVFFSPNWRTTHQNLRKPSSIHFQGMKSNMKVNMSFFSD
jgi:hypothetical protein